MLTKRHFKIYCYCLCKLAYLKAGGFGRQNRDLDMSTRRGARRGEPMKFSMSRIAFAVAAAHVVATPAQAQQTGGDAQQASPADIIVTARRVEERIQNVPISITVFNQQQLSNRNVIDGQQLAAFTPSLSAEGRFGPAATSYAIRGFVQDIGTAPSVGVYFDEVVAPRGPAPSTPAGDGSGPGMFFDLQNVQVLKGPQGTLFGRNTTGGAVILVPRKPTDKLEGYVEGSLGNYDMRRIQAVLNIPVTDTFRVRFGLDREKRDGYMKNLLNVGPSKFDDVNYISLRASAVWDITPDIENYTVATYTKSNTNGHVMKAVAGNCSVPLIGEICGTIAQEKAAGFYTLASDSAVASDRVWQWQVINKTKWQVNDNLTLRNIVSYARLETDMISPVAGTNFVVPANAYGPGYPSADSRFSLFVIGPPPGGHTSNHSTFTEEARAEGNADGGRLNYQAGVYYEYVRPEGPTGVQTTAGLYCDNPALVSPSCINLTGIGALNYELIEQRFRDTGIYAQASYAVTSKLKLDAGFRYTWDSSNIYTRQISYAFTPMLQNAHPLPFLPLDGMPGDYYDIIQNNSTMIGTITHCAQFLAAAPPLCAQSNSQKSSAPTWLLGVDYKPQDDILLYAKYSRGYRTGTLKGDLPPAFQVLQPEHVDTWEIGSKMQFSGVVKGTFNLSAFYNNFRNQQIQVNFLQNPLSSITVPPIPGLANVGKSRIWGIEAEAHVDLFTGFTLDAGYTYLNTRVQKVNLPVLPLTDPYIISGNIAVGDPLTYSPNHKLALTGTYTLPLDKSIGQVSISATWLYTSRQLYSYNGISYPFLATTEPGWDHSWLPANDLLNLNLNWNGFAGLPADLGIFVTNALDRHYYTAGFGLSLYGMEAATAGEPRMYGVRLKYRFGK
jgi:iron complex outermembrane receptor protein